MPENEDEEKAIKLPLDSAVISEVDLLPIAETSTTNASSGSENTVS